MQAKDLLARGLFPKEYPPAFTSQLFAEHVGTTGVEISPSPGNRRLITSPATHNLARPGGSRRRLHIPNPFSYLRLARLLESNWTVVQKQLTTSPLSVSTPITDSSGLRAVRAKTDGSQLAAERARVRSAARYSLRTDIVRFYGSLYTHSIPWALHGKIAAKAARHGGFANELDEAFRDLQDGQTLGIPVGPDASFIVAEVLASAIDRELYERGLRGFRFMDDFEFGFATRATAEAALASVEDVLARWELAVNPRKTSIDELPIELDRPWLAEIRTYPLGLMPTQSVLISFFNRVFELKKQFGYDPVLAYGVSRLGAVHVQDQWPLLRHVLGQCALAEPGALESLVAFLHSKKGDDTAGETVDSVLQTILEHQTDLSHGSELAWALWAAIWFKRPIPTVLAKRLDGNRDPAIALLTLCARSRGLIHRRVQFPKWKSAVTRESLYGPLWLLTYEADLQGWLRPTKRGVVASDPNFRPLRAAGVSFFNPDVIAPTNTLILGVPAARVLIYNGDEPTAVEESPARLEDLLQARRLVKRVRRRSTGSRS